MTRELVTVADLHGCAWCGISEARHDDRPGVRHLPPTAPQGFQAPSQVLLARRRAVRVVGGRPIGAIHPVTGEPTTSLVKCECRCGAVALATPKRAASARCAPCIEADASAAVDARIRSAA
jgi:hypothetical protein